MYLLFLGTGAGLPSKRRNVSAIVLSITETNRCLWLFDCGEGTQHQFLKSPAKLTKLRRIFLTHLHGDHLFGLPGLLSSRSFQAPDKPLSVYGPPGTTQWIENALTLSGTHLSYPLDVVEVDTAQAGESAHLAAVVCEDGEPVVSAAALNHTITCVGYRIAERDRPGRLDRDRLQAMGIPPGPIYKRLQQGESVTLPDGRVIDGRTLTGPPRRGRTVAILGDTAPCANAVRLAQEADVLVHEATFAAADEALAATYRHSTSLQAAWVAREAGARRLLLTHVSSRYSEDDLQRLLDEARSVFPDTDLAHDLWVCPVPKPGDTGGA
ncbi:MAG: ribonuclease Z [Alicyclobacillaceae bacterium]|nr:ribonuclease Z [Alicyclobacillaceae bacterium]